MYDGYRKVLHDLAMLLLATIVLAACTAGILSIGLLFK